jgi:hypothetical protein
MRSGNDQSAAELEPRVADSVGPAIAEYLECQIVGWKFVAAEFCLSLAGSC